MCMLNSDKLVENLEVDPLSHTAAKRCTMLASIAIKTLKFGYLIPC